MNSTPTATALADALETNGEFIDRLVDAVRPEWRANGADTKAAKVAVEQIRDSYFDPRVRDVADALLDRWDWAWIVEVFVGQLA